ncbi:tyrosine-type recombinase/integrase [Thermodesulfobacteriota bacterium]
MLVGRAPYAKREVSFTRHSFASQHVNNGVSLELIGAMMGHTNTQTTRKYAHLKKLEAMRNVFEK